METISIFGRILDFFKPLHESCTYEAVYTNVGELINPLTSYWDDELLGKLFNDVDVGCILQIPLNDYGFEKSISKV
jgi:hypothetical protein